MPWEKDASPGPRDPEGLPNNQEPLEGVTSQTQEVHLQEGQFSKNKASQIDVVDNGEDWLGSERLLKMLVFKTIC